MRKHVKPDALTRASSAEHRDDVDEVDELAPWRGRWIALVEDGALSGSEEVALAVRRHD